MPVREMAPIGAPCWIDLFTSDPDTTIPFYNELFGWTSESSGEEFGGYFTFSKNGEAVAGGMRNDGSAGPDSWFVYLATDDARAVAEAAKGNGGTVIADAMQVQDLGTMAVVLDPGGAAVGAWQPGTLEGVRLFAEPGAPGWFELHTRDYDRTVDFYKKVFHWDAHTMSDTPQFRYTTHGEGDTAVAGIMDAAVELPPGAPANAVLPEGASAHWSVYFVTPDTDAALDRVVELGGSVILPADDSPYGRLAQAADPTGIQFKLVQDAGASS
jgi:predicted enzyme related to lactoylglutathione lyase